MIDAFILDGDYVIMDSVASPFTGDMVAAEIRCDNEVTLKRFYQEGDVVRLQPENTDMDPIIVPAQDVSVKGKVIGVLRSL